MNMTHCCVENTANDLRQLLDLIHEEANGDIRTFLLDTNRHERNAWPELVELCTNVFELAVQQSMELGVGNEL